MEFLEFLEPMDELPKEILIRPFMVKNFDKPKDLKHYTDNEKEPGKQFLLDLLDTGLIDANEQDIQHICNKDWTNPVGRKRYQFWFDTYPIKVKITKLGLDKLEEYRTTHLISETLKSNRKTSEVVKENSKYQIAFSIISTAAIAVTAIVAIMAYNKDDPKSLILIRKSMQQQERILDSIRQSQKEISTYLEIVAKKTTPKKK